MRVFLYVLAHSFVDGPQCVGVRSFRAYWEHSSVAVLVQDLGWIHSIRVATASYCTCSCSSSSCACKGDSFVDASRCMFLTRRARSPEREHWWSDAENACLHWTKNKKKQKIENKNKKIKKNNKIQTERMTRKAGRGDTRSGAGITSQRIYI